MLLSSPVVSYYRGCRLPLPADNWQLALERYQKCQMALTGNAIAGDNYRATIIPNKHNICRHLWAFCIGSGCVVIPFIIFTPHVLLHV